jgi:hypothetical protein
MTDSQVGGTYQIVMDGERCFSAPYTDEAKAENRAREFEEEMPDSSFQVESWPNHRQEDTDSDQSGGSE